LGPILTLGGRACQKEKYQDWRNRMRAWTHRTEFYLDGRIDNATSSHSGVMLGHDRRIIAQVRDFMHAGSPVIRYCEADRRRQTSMHWPKRHRP
jgi:hypothetical protein